MKLSRLLLLVYLSLSFDLALASEAVVFSKPDPDSLETMRFFSDASHCSGPESSTVCRETVRSSERVAWGAGFCRNTESEVLDSARRAVVLLTVDGLEVDRRGRLTQYEHYSQRAPGHCHTWLVSLRSYP